MASIKHDSFRKFPLLSTWIHVEQLSNVSKEQTSSAVIFWNGYYFVSCCVQSQWMSCLALNVVVFLNNKGAHILCFTCRYLHTMFQKLIKRQAKKTGKTKKKIPRNKTNNALKRHADSQVLYRAFSIPQSHSSYTHSSLLSPSLCFAVSPHIKTHSWQSHSYMSISDGTFPPAP